MFFPIPHSRLLTRISVAILAQMGAGVVFTNVLAYDAAAELALAFVAVVAMDGIGVVGKDDGIGGQGCVLSEKCGGGNGGGLDFKEVHQGFVFVCKADDEGIVNTTILLDTKLL